MSMKRPDRRVRYTRQVLRMALLDLMREQPIEKITVRAVCERAEVGRATFYAHYRDAYDLLEQIENELFDQIKALLRGIPTASDQMRETLTRIFGCIAENADLCAVLFSENGDRKFLENVMNVAYEQFISEWTGTPADYLYAFAVNGSMGVIQTWVKGGMKEPARTIAELVWTIHRDGFRGIVKEMRG